MVYLQTKYNSEGEAQQISNFPTGQHRSICRYLLLESWKCYIKVLQPAQTFFYSLRLDINPSVSPRKTWPRERVRVAVCNYIFASIDRNVTCCTALKTAWEETLTRRKIFLRQGAFQITVLTSTFFFVFFKLHLLKANASQSGSCYSRHFL